jgi:uncharacterized protein YeaO (DUF488 family)
MATHRIRAARVYDGAGPDDGTRVLVDRLWPRGLSKDRAQVDVWLKELAQVRALVDQGPVTLLTATKDLAVSQAAALADHLR